MKLSTVMKPLSVLLFYLPFTWMLYSLFTQGKDLYIVLGIAFIMFMLMYFLRKHETKAVRIFLCILLILALSFVEVGFFLLPIPVYIFWMIFGIVSLVDIAKETYFMEKTNEFYSVLYIILYAVVYSFEKVNMYIAFCFFAVYVIAKHIQNVSLRNEQQLDIISNYSVIDRTQMQSGSNKSSIKTGLIMIVLCTLIGFVGKLSVFDGFNHGVRNIIKSVVNYVAHFDEKGEVEEPEGDMDMPEVEMGVDETPVHPFWKVLGIVGTIATIIYLIFLIVDKIITIRKNRVYMPDLGTEVRIIKEEEKEEKIKKAGKPEDFSYRKAMRRLYRNKIKKGRGKRNDDLMSKTPEEQRSKKISEGYEVSQDFVSMYERARYSDEIITKKDVKDMQNMR